MIMGKLFGKSRGTKRTIATVLGLLAVASKHVPVLMPYGYIIDALLGAVGSAAILHPLEEKLKQPGGV